MVARFVATAPIPPRPAPVDHRSLVERLRADFFPSVGSTCLTLALSAAILAAAVFLVRWGIVDAVFGPQDGMSASEACRAADMSGACWAVIGDKLRLILFGLYPYDEQWRPALACLLMILLYALSVRRSMWRQRLFWTWVIVLLVVGGLMWGGVLGLAFVPDSLWGGLPVTLILSTFGLAFAFPLAILLALARQERTRPVVQTLQRTARARSCPRRAVTTPPLLRIAALNKWLGDFHALRDIDLEVAEGERVVICGPSGSGKSTLVRCINRIETFEAGSIELDGVGGGADAEAVARIRRTVGMVFQQFNLFPHMTVLENCVLAPVRSKRERREEAQAYAMQLLERVRIADQAAKYPGQLSGGQQQRVAIARALCMRPRLMLFDEPTSALDPETIQEVLETIVSLARDGMTMICVTHEMGFARQVADRIVFMDEGQILESAAPSDFFGAPAHARSRELLTNRGLHPVEHCARRQRGARSRGTCSGLPAPREPSPTAGRSPAGVGALHSLPQYRLLGSGVAESGEKKGGNLCISGGSWFWVPRWHASRRQRRRTSRSCCQPTRVADGTAPDGRRSPP